MWTGALSFGLVNGPKGDDSSILDAGWAVRTFFPAMEPIIADIDSPRIPGPVDGDGGVPPGLEIRNRAGRGVGELP
jgi:hypothetical protein